MELVKRIKSHTTKDGKSFKKAHFYVRQELNGKIVEFEVEPVVFKDKHGKWNDYGMQLAHLLAKKVD